MSNPAFIIDSSENNNVLSSADIEKVKNILNNGGLVLLPSDTAYSVAAPIKEKEICKKAVDVLRRPDIPISIAFPNIEAVFEYVQAHPITMELFKKFTPGPITIVCPAKEKHKTEYIENVVRSFNRTFGTRIPNSEIERQVAGSTDFPITTIAVRANDQDHYNYDECPIVQDFDQAIDLLSDRMDKLEVPIWAAIKGSNFYDTNSTVIRVNNEKNKVELLRGGEVSMEDIIAAVNELAIWKNENWS